MQLRSNTRNLASNTVPPDYDMWIQNSINTILALPLSDSFTLSDTAKEEIIIYIKANLTAIPQRLTITSIEEIFDMYKKGLSWTVRNQNMTDEERYIYGFNRFFLKPLVVSSPLYNLYINLFETKNTNEPLARTRSNNVNFFFPIEFEISDLISIDDDGQKKINSDLSRLPLKLANNLYKTYINYNRHNNDGSYYFDKDNPAIDAHGNKKIGAYYINRGSTFSLLGEMFGQISNRNQSTVFGESKKMFIGQDADDSFFNKIESYLTRSYSSTTSNFENEHFNYFISILRNKCELLASYPSTSMTEYCFDDSCIKKIKLLLMFDNIHDFGKNRGDNKDPSNSYHTSNFKSVCNANTPQDDSDFCFINYIQKNHIMPLSQEIGRTFNFDVNWKITKDTTTNLINNVFSNNWEFELLKKLGSELNYIGTYEFHVIDANKTFIRTILSPTLPGGNFGDIVNDTMSPNDTKLLRRILNFNKTNNNIVFNHKKLLNSIFDGYSGSTPKDGDPNTYDVYENKHLYIPFPYNNPNPINPNNTENIIYTSYRDQTLKKHVIRNFPVRFGTGGSNDRTTGSYDRADNVTIESTGTDDKNIDHLTTVAKSAKNLLSRDMSRTPPPNANMLFADDISFFITLKALGDFTQLLEAKIRNAIFITQDSMQFIIGAFIGTKMLKVGSDGKIYYANMDPPTQQQVLPSCSQVLPQPSPRRQVPRTPPRRSMRNLSQQKKQKT